jgi:hypothetical protein
MSLTLAMSVFCRCWYSVTFHCTVGKMSFGIRSVGLTSIGIMSAHPTFSITYDHHSSNSRGVIYDRNIFIMQTIGCKILPGTNILAFLVFVDNEEKSFITLTFDHRKMLLGSFLQVNTHTHTHTYTHTYTHIHTHTHAPTQTHTYTHYIYNILLNYQLGTTSDHDEVQLSRLNIS